MEEPSTSKDPTILLQNNSWNPENRLILAEHTRLQRKMFLPILQCGWDHGSHLDKPQTPHKTYNLEESQGTVATQWRHLAIDHSRHHCWVQHLQHQDPATENKQGEPGKLDQSPQPQGNLTPENTALRGSIPNLDSKVWMDNPRKRVHRKRCEVSMAQNNQPEIIWRQNHSDESDPETKLHKYCKKHMGQSPLQEALWPPRRLDLSKHGFLVGRRF